MRLTPNPLHHAPAAPLTFYVDVGRAERAAREIEYLQDTLAGLDAQTAGNARLARKLEPQRKAARENLERARRALSSIPAYTHDRAVVEDALAQLAYITGRGREKHVKVILGVVEQTPTGNTLGVEALLAAVQEVAARDIVAQAVADLMDEIESLQRDRAADLDILTPVVDLLQARSKEFATTALDVVLSEKSGLSDALTMTAFAALASDVRTLADECARRLPNLPPALVPVEVNIPVEGRIDADKDDPPFSFHVSAEAWPIQTRRIERREKGGNHLAVWHIDADAPDIHLITPNTRIIRYYPLAAVKPAL